MAGLAGTWPDLAGIAVLTDTNGARAGMALGTMRAR